MTLPGNGIFIVRGEVSTLLTAANRSKWMSIASQNEGEAATLRSLLDLKQQLMSTDDLKTVSPRIYLRPFLGVIRSEKTSGQLTSLALGTVYKILTYGLLGDGTEVDEVAELLDDMAEAATHTRFVGSDQATDGVVLLRVVQVLKLLMLGPEGKLLSNGSICEIMLCCFRICFEPKLNELLRRTAESALKDMVLSLFVQLPTFVEEEGTIRQLKINGNLIDSCTKSQSQSSLKVEVTEATPETTPEVTNEQTPLLTTPLPLANRLIDVHGITTPKTAFTQFRTPRRLQTDREVASLEPEVDDRPQFQPYGMPCVRELFPFLISLCDPTDKQNTDTMVHTGLTLLSVAFETASAHIAHFPSLLGLVQNDLCKNLIALLDTDRLSILAVDLQLCFLIFESMRSYLKFQLEKYLVKICAIISNDSGKIQHDIRELVLENLIQFWKIPSFLSEIYINYDCDFYSSNVLKDTVQQLFKYAQTALNVDSVCNLHIEALSTIVEAISRYHVREASGIAVTLDMKGPTQDIQTTPTGPSISLNLASHEPRFQIGAKTILVGIKKENLLEIERKKAILGQGIELFNKNPDRGIQFLQEHKILRTAVDDIDPNEIVLFLREHPLLDKRVIGEFISKRKNAKILKAYVSSFNFEKLRIDKALRIYLEAFRLPGEAPLISSVMEEFAEHWHTQNEEPFANPDAAFRLAYAIIMLNMDQHNQNAKRLNVPMTEHDFIRNLRGLNGNGDFDKEMLAAIYDSIRTNEMVLPSEQAGPVRDNYLWQVLLRRGSGPEGVFYHAFESVYAEMIFRLVAKPIVGVLSASLERGDNYERVKAGFAQTAYLSSLYGMHEELDSLVLTLCKLTMLLGCQENTRIASHTAFAESLRSQVATQTLFEVIHLYGAQGVREGWKYIIDILVRLFKLKLLPDSFVIVEDFCEPDGKYSLIKENAMAKADSGLFSSLYTYLSPDQKDGEDAALILAKQSIERCQLDAIFTKSKLLCSNALEDVIEYLMSVIKCPRKHVSEKGQQIPDDILSFSLELLVKILSSSSEMLSPVWSKTSSDLFEVLTCTADCGADAIMYRINSALLRISINAMQNEDMCPEVLQALALYTESPTAARIHKIAFHVATGVNELLKKSAQNIHTDKEWEVIFSLLEVYGAGVSPEMVEAPADTAIITYPCKLIKHSPAAFKKSVDSMAFIIRNVAHVTPYNFERCVASVRKFLEAALVGQKVQEKRPEDVDADDQDERHHSLVLQLLDLMHTLHARTAQIYKWWAEEGGPMPSCSTLWQNGWCPLLQGMARAGFDKRKEIRTSAITCLQRALLVHDLETLTGTEWSSCLQDVLFPLLKYLISLKVKPHELNSIEESRSRTTSMMCKVFLHHLQPLLLLPNINQLWLDILSYIECLTRIGSDELVEAVKESLKNMLLVMRSVKIFSTPENTQNAEFWDLTWKRLEGFLPTLKDELLEQDLFLTHGRRDIQIPSPTELLQRKLESKQPEERRESNVSQSSPYVSILTPSQSPPVQSPVLLSPVHSPAETSPVGSPPSETLPVVEEPQQLVSTSPPKFTPTSIIKNLQEAENRMHDDEAFVNIEKVADVQVNGGAKTTFDYCETRETILCLDETVVDEKPGVNVFMPSAYFSNVNGAELNDFVGLQKPV